MKQKLSSLFTLGDVLTQDPWHVSNHCVSVGGPRLRLRLNVLPARAKPTSLVFLGGSRCYQCFETMIEFKEADPGVFNVMQELDSAKFMMKQKFNDCGSIKSKKLSVILTNRLGNMYRSTKLLIRMKP